MKPKLIDLHNTIVKNKRGMPVPSLCTLFEDKYKAHCKAEYRCYNYNNLFSKFKPSYAEIAQLYREGKNPFFWASGSGDEKMFHYTPLRQTVILLMCAIRKEL